MNFETVIGLEVHCELKTKSKMFSGAPVTFGEAPNTNANIVDMGMTGAMPVLNKSGVEFAIRVGIYRTEWNSNDEWLENY